MLLYGFMAWIGINLLLVAVWILIAWRREVLEQDWLGENGSEPQR